MKEEDKSKLVEVFNGSLWEAELVKSLLENNGIELGEIESWVCSNLEIHIHSSQIFYTPFYG